MISEREMTRDELTRICEALWGEPRPTGELVRLFGEVGRKVTPGAVSQWFSERSGARPIPRWVDEIIEQVVERRIVELDERAAAARTLREKLGRIMIDPHTEFPDVQERLSEVYGLPDFSRAE